MNTTLTTPNATTTVATSTGALLTVKESTVEALRSLYECCTSANTRATYKAQAKAFSKWCAQIEADFSEGVEISAELVALHIAHLREEGAKLATVRSRVAWLAWWHKAQGLTSPTTTAEVRQAVKGYEKSLADAAKESGAVELLARPSAALLRGHLHRILDTIDTTTLSGLRDRALFLLGWCGAFRASELVGLRLEHITHHEHGLLVTAHATKTGKSVTKEVWREEETALCPVAALEAWLRAAGVQEGLVFRSVSKSGRVGGSLSRYGLDDIMKAYAVKAHLPEGKWSWHSLRAGYATQHVVDRDVPEAYIRRQGGWSANSPVFLGYVERAEAFTVRRARVSR